METFEGKANVKTVNGQAPDSGGNVNVKEYSHPNSGVTAGTYRKVTVNAQGHVTKGENPTLAISEGGTGATTAAAALKALGIDGAITDLAVDGRTITYTKKDGTTGTITTQDTVTTNTSNWSISQGTNGWARDNTTGFTIQWGIGTGSNTSDEQQVGPYTFPRAFSEVYTILTTLINTDSSHAGSYDGGFQVRSWNNTQFYLFQQKYSSSAWFSQFMWVALGIS